MLEHHVIHASLFRPVLFAGAEPAAVMLEALTAGGLLFGVGFHGPTIALAAFYVTVVHSLMARLAAKDPQISQLYLRSLAARDYYPAQSALTARVAPVRPSIPAAR